MHPVLAARARKTKDDRTLMSFHISRRRFLKTTSASLALSTLGADGAELASPKTKTRRADRRGLVRQERPLAADPGRAGRSGFDSAIRTSTCSPAPSRSPASGRSRRSSRAPTPITARCSRRRTSTSCSSARPTTGTRCTASPRSKPARMSIARSRSACDVREGEAMLAAARKHKRVVQIGTQRKSTPHLIDAKKQVVDAGPARQDRPRGHVLLLPHARQRQSARRARARFPRLRNVDRPRAAAALRRPAAQALVAHVHGIRQRHRRRHVRAHVRHRALDARPRLAQAHHLAPAASYVQKEGKSNITDTQTATFEYDDFNCVWQHRTWGTPPDPDYPWALFIYGEKGTLKASTMRADFIPLDKNAKPHPLRLRLRDASSIPRT